ncbi:16S rRNA (guanine(966)-N(2))-methyltransferase RsmD [Prosthecobacter dejongeii]|uniref:16S rRNA (Guanine966-N2)-methyltransferase n=1 Tax=Prosthecobacter dejongeii TaxID=48465 RepID=A0A7W7YMN6_9BACT|nr:16S rRNA (guanine(966)-N(2))-methyltransferase RsmD [Prosthecobacter dejongeii]MBB5039031.1 16S rRNA (guanine966-N2)-methyltransferase [Prosthecobacter dejongeii]
MRLISGSAGGIPLDVPKNVTRPTQDRVKQAIFNMLGELVDGARVLDLFAGSGALGLECLSRGAVSAQLIEQDRAACEVIRKNIAKTRLEGASVKQGDVFKVLSQMAGTTMFDLVFADPPYAHQLGEEDLSMKLALFPELQTVIVPGGSLILECRVTKNAPVEWGPWEMVRDREYGGTRILWLRKR